MRAPSVAGKCNWDQSTLLFSDVKPGSSFNSQQDTPCEQDEPTSPKVSCIGQVQVNMPKKLRTNLDNEGKIINQQNNGKFPFTRSAFLLLQRRKTPKTMQRLDLKGAEKTEATVSNPNCKFDLTRSTSAREISVCRSTVNRKSPSMGGILEQSLELLEAKYKQNNQKIPGSKAPEQRDELPSEAVQNSPKPSSEICIWKRRCFAEPLRLSLQRPPPVGSS
ncbi:hypothetical protein O6H91_04G116300 [Diphasiastrum complanatum]|nr:hypothetical protein O6H91_04G116300 [Diphasiastrum complanatum]